MYVKHTETNSWPCLFFSHMQWTVRENLSAKSVSIAFCHIMFLSTFPLQPSMNRFLEFLSSCSDPDEGRGCQLTSSSSGCLHYKPHLYWSCLHSLLLVKWSGRIGKLPSACFLRVLRPVWSCDSCSDICSPTDPRVSEETFWHERRSMNASLSWASLHQTCDGTPQRHGASRPACGLLLGI